MSAKYQDGGLINVGAFWAYTSREGRDYWRGMIRILGAGDVQVMLFRNPNKHEPSDGRPDFVVLRAPEPAEASHIPSEADDPIPQPF